VDCALVVAIVLWMFFFKVYASVLADKIRQEFISACIYAVEVRGLPGTREEGAPTENEMKNHFS